VKITATREIARRERQQKLERASILSGQIIQTYASWKML
jgi:hypothetical protein